jgi:hypothetical protein
MDELAVTIMTREADAAGIPGVEVPWNNLSPMSGEPLLVSGDEALSLLRAHVRGRYVIVDTGEEEWWELSPDEAQSRIEEARAKEDENMTPADQQETPFSIQLHDQPTCIGGRVTVDRWASRVAYRFSGIARPGAHLPFKNQSPTSKKFLSQCQAYLVLGLEQHQWHPRHESFARCGVALRSPGSYCGDQCLRYGKPGHGTGGTGQQLIK